jgi:murein DD-endopeptidase MepM/ murein hydrolase activator NlpD
MSRNSVTIRALVACRPMTRAGLVGAALLVAGCSADVSRFDSPFFGMNESASTGSLSRGDAPSSANLSDQSPSYGGGGSYTPPPRESVRMAALPEPSAPTPSGPAYGSGASPAQPAAGAFQPSARQAPVRPAAAVPSGPAPAAGDSVDVQPGDTLFGIARRHDVRVDDIKRLNNLSGTMIRPGQRLVLPAKGPGATATTAARKVATAPQSTSVAAPPAAPARAMEAQPAADAPGTYTMKPGDSLYTVARSQKVSLAELQRINNISDPSKLRVGTVLKLREDAAAVPVAQAAPPAVPAVEPELQRPLATTTRPTIINGGAPAAGSQVAAVDQRAVINDATAPRPGLAAPSSAVGTEVASAAGAAAQGATALSFRWPVKGRVISGFGPRPDGTQNDGIDIAVPLGTEVVAAESGVVAYAGSELKGFGNLVLVRHEGGWVTAYAHNEEVIVKRGDKVRRGQPIAKAGKTGNVDQPTVHFEIRQGSKPVDPAPYLEK